MNYALDVGNTAIKLGEFQGNDLINVSVYNRPEELAKYLKRVDGGDFIICSVSGNHGPLIDIVNQSARVVHVLAADTRVPVSNRYKSPDTLGMDRIAAVCGARKLYPNQNCMVVDFGTCITYDLVDMEGNYYGGSISPGWKMRFRAMNSFTNGLPNIEEISGEIEDLGTTTRTSMESGVYYGIMGEIEKFIVLNQERFESLKVLFCGGDAERFESMVKDPIFAAPNLVLVGLNSILRYNEEP